MAAPHGSGIARKWFDVDKVDAIVDVPTSSVGMTVQEVSRERQKIFLISGAASAAFTGKACQKSGRPKRRSYCCWAP